MKTPRDAYHDCTPVWSTILPASPSLSPSSTFLKSSPPRLGSPAPSFFNNPGSPPRFVANCPGETPQTLTPSAFNVQCHAKTSMFSAVLLTRYPVGAK